MTVVDTSVLVNVLREGVENEQVDHFRELVLHKERIGLTGVIRYELLRGFRPGRQLRLVTSTISGFEHVEVLGEDFYDRSAERYRDLRRRGITIRKSADVLIASACIDADLPLLTSDRDFLPFAEHHGLRLVGWSAAVQED